VPAYTDWIDTVIPEPATLGLLIIGALAILRRRLVRRSPKGEDGS